MTRLKFVYAFLGMAAALSGQRVGMAQSAFYPIARYDTAYDAAIVYYDLLAWAQDTSDTMAMGPNSSSGSDDDDDPNLATLSEDCDASEGEADASSSALPEAEVLPNTGDSSTLAECIAVINGTFTCSNGSGTCYTKVTNDQTASAAGTFQVLENPTYPGETSGTLQISFELVSSYAWITGTAGATAGDAWVMVNANSDGTYDLYGDLGAGDFEDSGSGMPGFTYTATQSVSVGDTFTMGANVGGWLEDMTASGVGGLSMTTSVYVSSP